MPAFIIGTVRISDPERFQQYADAIRGLSAKFEGQSVVAGQVGEVLEGASPIGERVVVVRFPDAAKARAYIESDTYRAARGFRIGAADIELRLVETA